MTPRAVLSRGRQFAGIGIWRRSENRWRPPDGSSPGYFLNKDQKKGEKKAEIRIWAIADEDWGPLSAIVYHRETGPLPSANTRRPMSGSENQANDSRRSIRYPRSMRLLSRIFEQGSLSASGTEYAPGVQKIGTCFPSQPPNFSRVILLPEVVGGSLTALYRLTQQRCPRTYPLAKFDMTPFELIPYRPQTVD